MIMVLIIQCKYSQSTPQLLISNNRQTTIQQVVEQLLMNSVQCRQLEVGSTQHRLRVLKQQIYMKKTKFDSRCKTCTGFTLIKQQIFLLYCKNDGQSMQLTYYAIGDMLGF